MTENISSPSQKGRIFISYRRADSAGYAGRIYDRLVTQFGVEAIFMDVDTIEGGADFVQVLEDAIESCDVLIALIGKQWLTIKDKDGKRRLDNPEDFVRIEIATALNRNIRVVPVLVDGVEMPQSGELPENLKALARRNALQVNHHSFNPDVYRLIEHTKSALEEAEESRVMKAEALQAARQKAEREGAEKFAQEKARLVAEEQTRQKATKEQAEREIVEKAAREKVKREADEKTALEKVELETKLKEEYEKEHTIKPKHVIPKNEKQKPFKPVAEKSSINRYFPLFIIIAVGILIVSLFIYSQTNKPVDFIQIEFKSRPAVNANATGDPNAPIKIVEFSDFQSPYSSRFTQITEPQFVDDYVAAGKVYFIHRSFGSFIGTESKAAAEAAYCAGDQGKFWDYHDLLYANQISENAGSFNERRLLAFAEGVELDIDIFKTCVDSGKYSSQVLQDYNDGNSAGIQGVPSFLMTYVVNGQTKTKLIEGAQPFSTFQQEIDAALAEINQ